MIDLAIFTEEDFSRLIRWISSPDLLIQWAGPQQFTYPLTENQLNTYLRDGQGDNSKSKIFKVVSETAEVVGHIELGSINRVSGTASICRVFLDHGWRGRGICVEMVRRVLEIGFHQLNLRRIDLRAYAFNQAAIRCYERAGLVREGVLRKSQRFGDQYWDTVIMAILREEWS